MLKKKHSSLIISYVILIVLAYVMIYPLLWMVGASFKSNAEIFSTVGLLPKEPVFGAFKAGWEGTGRYGFSTYLINSFELVLPTVLFTVISGVLIGYGFARFDFPLKKFWFAIMLSTLMLPSTVIIIPRYIYFKQLGWLDSYMPFWIPALLGCTTFFNYTSGFSYRSCCRSASQRSSLQSFSSSYGYGTTSSTLSSMSARL